MSFRRNSVLQVLTKPGRKSPELIINEGFLMDVITIGCRMKEIYIVQRMKETYDFQNRFLLWNSCLASMLINVLPTDITLKRYNSQKLYSLVLC
jgi:hypothetical protein